MLTFQNRNQVVVWAIEKLLERVLVKSKLPPSQQVNPQLVEESLINNFVQNCVL